MRLYVQSYEIRAFNNYHPIMELGFSQPVGVIRGAESCTVHCDFMPIADNGESMQDVLRSLSQWINGREINMVLAKEDRPRCFYCGTMNDAGSAKCPQCGGEMR